MRNLLIATTALLACHDVFGSEVKSGCGYINENGVGNLPINQRDQEKPMEAKFGEFPWMVAFLQKRTFNGEFKVRCAGTLIAPNVVLTTTTCVNGVVRMYLPYIVRLGEWNRNSTDEVLNHIDVTVKSMVTHENFRMRPLANDIGLVFLTKEVTLNQHINTICLPPSNMKFENRTCVVTSWKVTPDEGSAEKLKKIELAILKRDYCSKIFRFFFLRKVELHESIMCAGVNDGASLCEGDPGVPLLCEASHGRYYQVGINSFGLPCPSKTPEGFTDISYMRSWIDEKMAENGVDKKFYEID